MSQYAPITTGGRIAAGLLTEAQAEKKASIRRELSALAMQGILANGWDQWGIPEDAAKQAVKYADALMAELEKTA